MIGEEQRSLRMFRISRVRPSAPRPIERSSQLSLAVDYYKNDSKRLRVVQNTIRLSIGMNMKLPRNI
jgi:hypothetical protein